MKFVWTPDAKRVASVQAWERWKRDNIRVVRAAVVPEVPVDTGALRTSVGVHTTGQTHNGLSVVRVQADSDYAIYVHQGRGEVRPVKAKVLRWFDKLGNPVFARRSRAVPANKFIIRGLRKVGIRTEERRR